MSAGARVSAAFSTDAATLDPALAFNVPAQSIIRHLYEPLVSHDRDGRLLPVLAESWVWRDDHRTLDLTIRAGVTFHTGAPLTAYDVKYTFDRILAADTRSRQKPTLFYIADTEALDALTIRIRAHIPASPLLAILSLYPLGIVNAGWTRKHGEDLSTRANGTGPFRLVEYVPRQEALLEANPNYWGRRPALDRLAIRIVPDAKARVEALRRGQVTMINAVPPHLAGQVKERSGLRLAEAVTARSIFGQVNLTNPPFGEREIRHALNYAVDKDQIVRKVLGGYGEVARCPVAPSVLGHHPEMAPWPYDPARARSLLEQAGYPASAPLTVRLIGPSGRYMLDTQVGRALAESLSGAGMRTTYRSLDADAYAGARADLKAWDVMLAGWCVHTLEADFLLSRNFDHEWIPVGYVNPRVQALLAQAREAADDAGAASCYRQAQELIWGDAPWLWLYYQADIHAVSDRLSGFRARPDEFLMFHEASVAG